jgi:AraC-like DNA-binding protein
MSSIRFDILPPPDVLKNVVECFRIAEYTGKEGLAINVTLNGLPGIVFQHHNGRSPVESIVSPSISNFNIPTSHIYGQTTEPSVLSHKKGPFTMTQVILRPHALRTLFGMNACELTDGLVELNEFSTEDLNVQLIEAKSEQQHMSLLTNFLLTRLKQERTRDRLVEESLNLIHKNIGSMSIKYLLEHLLISERQFEKRFSRTVGLSPQFYIRVKRFNAAIRLMKTGQFEKLTDVAQALCFYDHSHFIRDFKAFSGMTPTRLAQTEAGFYHGEAGYTSSSHD